MNLEQDIRAILRTEIKKHLKFKDVQCELNEIRSKNGVYVYRIITTSTSYVIKYFEKNEFRRELDYYNLLIELEIPTIPVISMTDQSIILEDIEQSETYRLGFESDLENENVARGLVAWYTQFHKKGRIYLKQNPEQKASLYNEYNELTKNVITDIMTKTGTNHYKYWHILINHFDDLIAQSKSYTSTLTYNDFYYTNFIVSKDESEVIMFDYNFLGVGYRYSDVRNIVSSLKGNAKSLFLACYPQCNEGEVILDDVLADLFVLKEAYKRDQFPSWAKIPVEQLDNGVFEQKVLKLKHYFKFD
ncbi:hypothetical protein [Haloplasma contractile]|uniref:Aminoglycoside phosphotransferase domain-containing protein n=1 Tax=Haloplasma contractile SSD-17B TaxID=1033810 RepID=F7PTL5_9MOLU|nr:hypothetical protein [Haloplasma contractile]ERJ12179.1 hypothetical protein HLPCO_001706 [Haloplasma contractile SSD-17B]